MLQTLEKREGTLIMKKLTIGRKMLVTVVCVALLGQVSYGAQTTIAEEDVMALPVVTEAVKETPQEALVITGTVAVDSLDIREQPGTEQHVIGTIYKGQALAITESDGDWRCIKSDKLTGWVHADYVSNVKTITEVAYKEQISRGTIDRKNPPVANTKATAIIELAKKQIGKPYVYGSAGPRGFDCSGLMTYIFKSQGISVPRSSVKYTSFGTTVTLANARAGDIAVFDTSGPINGVASHVGILVGNGQVLHAATGGRGVVYDSLSAPYYAQRLIKIIRVL